jgi:hypothetical protein
LQDAGFPVPTTVVGFVVTRKPIGELHTVFGRGQHRIVSVATSSNIVVEVINDIPIIFSRKKTREYERIPGFILLQDLFIY